MAFTARTPNACIHAPCNSGTSASPAQALTNVQGIAPSSAILHLFRETVARTKTNKDVQACPDPSRFGPQSESPTQIGSKEASGAEAHMQMAEEPTKRQRRLAMEQNVGPSPCGINQSSAWLHETVEGWKFRAFLGPILPVKALHPAPRVHCTLDPIPGVSQEGDPPIPGRNPNSC